MMDPKEMPENGYKIIARVVSQKGTCGFGYKVGDEVVFGAETIQGRVCISALYSFLPKVYAMRYGATFPWLKENKDVASHACPDALNPVVFEICRVRD